jgi:hypothetical protein
MLREGLKIWKKDVFGGREALLFEAYLGSHTKLAL